MFWCASEGAPKHSLFQSRTGDAGCLLSTCCCLLPLNFHLSGCRPGMAFCPENRPPKVRRTFYSYNRRFKRTHLKASRLSLQDQSALHLFRKSPSPAQGPSPVSCAALDRKRVFLFMFGCASEGAPKHGLFQSRPGGAGCLLSTCRCLLPLNFHLSGCRPGMAFCPENRPPKVRRTFYSYNRRFKRTHLKASRLSLQDQSALHLFEKSASPAQGPSPVSYAALEGGREFFCLCFRADSAKTWPFPEPHRRRRLSTVYLPLSTSAEFSSFGVPPRHDFSRSSQVRNVRTSPSGSFSF